jgi:hypothetical protein
VDAFSSRLCRGVAPRALSAYCCHPPGQSPGLKDAMPGPAQVRSTDAIEAFSLALAKFQERVQSALDVLEGDLRRTDNWIDHDRPPHWRGKIHDAESAVHDAKLDLDRCLLMTTLDGQRPACREQKAALEQAKARLEYCREKGDLVKKWQRSFRHDSTEFKGRIGQLRRLVEQDVPTARAVLAKLLRRLDEYQVERPPDAWSAGGSATTSAEVHSRTPAPATDATLQPFVEPEATP